MEMINLNVLVPGPQPGGGQFTGKQLAGGKAPPADLFRSLLGNLEQLDAAEGMDPSGWLAAMLNVPATLPQVEVAGEQAAIDALSETVPVTQLQGTQPPLLATGMIDQLVAEPRTEPAANGARLPQELVDTALQTGQASMPNQAGTELTPTDISLGPAAAAQLDQRSASGRPAQPLKGDQANRLVESDELPQPTTSDQLLVTRPPHRPPTEPPRSAAKNATNDPRFARLIPAKPTPGQPVVPAPQPTQQPLRQQLEPVAEQAAVVEQPLAVQPAEKPSQDPDLPPVPAPAASHPQATGMPLVPPELPGTQATPNEPQPLLQPGHIRLPSGLQVPERQVIDQVLFNISGSRSGQSGKATLHLHPAELGEIKIDISVDHDRLKAHMVTQSVQVQEILERHLPRLRESLEQHGLHVEAFEVNVESRQSQSDTWQQQFARDRQALWQRSHGTNAQPRNVPLPHPTRPAASSVGNGGISLHI